MISPQVRTDRRFLDFVRLFNSGRFFEAHEVLEALWLETPREGKDLLQGLVQIAVALEHHRRRNLAGARKVLRRARKRLAGEGRWFGPIDLIALLDAAEGHIEGRAPDPPLLPAPTHNPGEKMEAP